jgi:hypothetical protein
LVGPLIVFQFHPFTATTEPHGTGDGHTDFTNACDYRRMPLATAALPTPVGVAAAAAHAILQWGTTKASQVGSVRCRVNWPLARGEVRCTGDTDMYWNLKSPTLKT